VGDDPGAAELSGINTRRVLFSVYVVAGLIMGISAWIYIGRVGSASPNADPLINLDTITAVVIGGTSLFGGRGTMIGTLIGTFIIIVVENGLALAGLDQAYRVLAVGILVILAVAPALDISENLFLGREVRKEGFLGKVFRTLDKKRMRNEAAEHLRNLGIGTVQNITQAVETLSGGQRQAVAVARAATFGSKVIILDEPTAALGVNESARVLQLIKDLRDRGMPVILISHNMPQVFEVADRIHIQRLGKRAAVVTPQSHAMNEVVAIMTGALTVDESAQALGPVRAAV
jgi:ABC-type dipeptide/oligopeptide/nickel transport system ATPase subunit